MDTGYNIIIKKACALGKSEAVVEAADREYRRILRGQDSDTANCPVFQLIAALSVVETHVIPSQFGL